MATKEKDAMDTMIPMLQKQWGELGVDFKANTMEFNTVIATVSDDSAVGDWDVSYLGNSFTSPEDTGVDYLIQSQGVNNLARLKDDELDDLKDKAETYEEFSMDALWEMKKLEKAYKELTGRDIKEDLEKMNKC